MGFGHVQYMARCLNSLAETGVTYPVRVPYAHAVVLVLVLVLLVLVEVLLLLYHTAYSFSRCHGAARRRDIAELFSFFVHPGKSPFEHLLNSPKISTLKSLSSLLGDLVKEF